MARATRRKAREKVAAHGDQAAQKPRGSVGTVPELSLAASADMRAGEALQADCGVGRGRSQSYEEACFTEKSHIKEDT